MMGNADTDNRPEWDGIDIAALLRVERIDAAISIGRITDDNRNGRVFGGQLIGQSLAAACASVEPGRTPTALRVLFMQGALIGTAIEYRVFFLQNGKRYSSCRVEARQGTRLLIDVHVSFQVPAEGPSHALPPYQDIPQPDEVLSMAQIPDQLSRPSTGGRWGEFEKTCLEMKVVHPEQHLAARSELPCMSYWMRLRKRLPDDHGMHYAALAFLSDYWINSAAITHHVAAQDAHEHMYVASLNHALWFHQLPRADEWLLFSCESPGAQQGRALTHARVYDQNLTLLASVSQECLMADRASI
ncbi:acyl-CoA thioesterase [Noviherbaspirillum saxi]|nr:acyl-CoA thioesterase domain-containing protein [Noviherbaspirillum saxi]